MGPVAGAWQWLTTGANWAGEKGVWHRLGEHLWLSGLCLVLSCLIALPVALWLGHLGKGGALAVNVSNIGRAVPTYAVLVLLTLSPLGTAGDWPTVIALVLFAVPPLLTNAYLGMHEADRDAVEAARGMGMSGPQLLLRVEIPLAYPLLMTGIRSAAVQVVATATLAALAGGGGLGRIITAGFGNYNTAQVVAGALLVAVLALLVEGLLVLADRAFDPMRGRRRAGRTARRAGNAALSPAHKPFAPASPGVIRSDPTSSEPIRTD
ncbi:ABC transporter permease [Streptomyces gilvosporeus]|uniref:ABC transporter permease n=1 Tax=Streptomyces gilvosporeus TaxID=553510 RepID=A0A1V0TUW3_9ACTN|nr:ABC transporter permease subunit [Streptomyces gilvosporeus]ARF56739.1 ABC transporter permease [Streptomyces gilvosporeus]